MMMMMMMMMMDDDDNDDSDGGGDGNGIIQRDYKISWKNLDIETKTHWYESLVHFQHWWPVASGSIYISI